MTITTAQVFTYCCIVAVKFSKCIRFSSFWHSFSNSKTDSLICSRFSQAFTVSRYESLLVLNCWQIEMFPVILHLSLRYWLIHSRTFLVQEAILPSRSPKVGWESNISELAVMQLGTEYEVAKLLKEIFAARPAKPGTCTFCAMCEDSSAANNPYCGPKIHLVRQRQNFGPERKMFLLSSDSDHGLCGFRWALNITIKWLPV